METHVRTFRSYMLAYSLAGLCWAILSGSALAAPIKVLPAGDSITMGQTYVAPPDDTKTQAEWFAGWVGYRYPLHEALVTDGYTVDFVGSQTNGCGVFADCQHEGHGGWSIALVDTQITTWITTYSPDVILVHVGTVDNLNPSLRDGAAGRLDLLLQHIQTAAPNAVVVVASLPPIVDTLTDGQSNAAVQVYNAALPAIVAARAAGGQRLVLVHPGLVLDDLTDGLHPLPVGYQKIATAMEEGIELLLPPPCEPRPAVSVETTKLGAGRMHVTIRTLGPGNTMVGFSFAAVTNATIEASSWEYRSGTAVGVNFDIQASTNAPASVTWTLTDQCGAIPGEVASITNEF